MFRITVLLTTIVISLSAFEEIVPEDETVVPADNEKIVGGFQIDITKVPYQVSIQTRAKEHFCGGTLIKPDVVLTAAHCVVDDLNPENYLLYLGSSDRTSGGVAIPAKSIKFNNHYNGDSIINDIALIRMSSPATMSDKINTIPLANINPPAGTTVLATGWGKLKEKDPPTAIPKMLMGVNLKTISLSSCRDAYNSYLVRDTNICAYTAGKDTCQGDSGGPLVANNTLVAVVSWGIGCAKKGNPGVYTSVPGFHDWIEENLSTL